MAQQFSVELTTLHDKTCCDGAVHLKAVLGGHLGHKDEAANYQQGEATYQWHLHGGGMLVIDPADASLAVWKPEGASAGDHTIGVTATLRDGRHASDKTTVKMLGAGKPTPTVNASVTLRRSESIATYDLALGIVILKATEALSFENYSRYMDVIFCGAKPNGVDQMGIDPKTYKDEFHKLAKRRFLPYTDSESYRLLKAATEAFVMSNCGVALEDIPFNKVDLDNLARNTGLSISQHELKGFWDSYLVKVNGSDEPTLPYLALIRDKLRDSPLVGDIVEGAMRDFNKGDGPTTDHCYGIIRSKLLNPCLLELIWCYWHEEGMLVQTMNAITTRFQNVRGPMENDPLRMMEVDPLRPVNNLLWGYIQDEQHRLTVVRRAYEYDHQYGLTLYGKAVPKMRSADSRSRFIEAFHNLLYVSAGFYKQDDDTTVVADGFPVLNAIKEVHLILSEGAHNQYGDMPSTARIEMLMQQWILARPEFREYLPTRTMVAYPERWMDRVDSMKTLQRWSDAPVLHFRDLGVFGEQLLLSIRFGAWSKVFESVQAANWARLWRPKVQGYTHAYRAVTGIDLNSETVEARQKDAKIAQPWIHLRNRLTMQAQRRA